MKLKDFFPKIFNHQKEAASQRKRLIIMILTIFFIVVIFSLIIISPIAAYQYLYKDKIYSGVYIDGVNLGSLTASQAIDRLNQHIDNLKTNGLNFSYQNKKLKTEINIVSPTDPDLSYQLLDFDTDLMVKKALAFGRDQDFFTNLQNQMTAILNQKEIVLIYSLKEAELKDILKQNFIEFDNPGQDAQITFGSDNNIVIQKETSGQVLDYDQAISALKKNINLVSINAVELKIISAIPAVTQSEGENLKPQIAEILQQDEIVFSSKDKKWEIAKEEFKNWLKFKKENNEIKLGFKDDLLGQKLQAIAAEINVPPQDAKFTFSEGKVQEFVPSLPGLEVDLEQSQIKIEQEFLNTKIQNIELVIKESEPAVKIGDINNLGIKELLGKGVSDFAGSHTNRIKNIKNAVAHLNGIIIPPGEFSTVDAIGPVNAATGYFSEYVIKGDRTILEYGGGLCQIGTTMFRAALYSGLPITERRPHSYIVTYYKPLGMDATIYGPHPDLRFINDTGYNILLKIDIEGTILTYEFWGTGDGRKVEITEPELFNWTGQPADRLIENPKLKPGEKKLMEKGRRGADASFYRYITNVAGDKKEEIFRSHYVAWPNIYEVGLQPTPPTPDVPAEDTNSAAPSPSGSSGNQNTNSQ